MSALSEVAGLIHAHQASADSPAASIATARAVLRRLSAAARLEGGVWTGQWLDREAAAEVTEP